MTYLSSSSRGPMDAQGSSAYPNAGLPRPKLKDGEISMGTSIVAVTFNGGVILGADSRTSNGNYIANRVTDKITPLADKVYILRSGSAADTQAIAGYVQLYVSQHQAELNQQVAVKTVAHMAQGIAYQNKEMLQAGLIVAGWDAREGGTVYAIPLGGTMLQVPYAIGGSGSAYIYGYCDKFWRPNMSEQEAKAFVVTALSLAMSRDGSSGGCIRTVIVDATGVKRDFLPGDQVPLHHGELAAPTRQAQPAVTAA